MVNSSSDCPKESSSDCPKDSIIGPFFLDGSKECFSIMSMLYQHFALRSFIVYNRDWWLNWVYEKVTVIYVVCKKIEYTNIHLTSTINLYFLLSWSSHHIVLELAWHRVKFISGSSGEVMNANQFWVVIDEWWFMFIKLPHLLVLHSSQTAKIWSTIAYIAYTKCGWWEW